MESVSIGWVAGCSDGRGWLWGVEVGPGLLGSRLFSVGSAPESGGEDTGCRPGFKIGGHGGGFFQAVPFWNGGGVKLAC